MAPGAGDLLGIAASAGFALVGAVSPSAGEACVKRRAMPCVAQSDTMTSWCGVASSIVAADTMVAVSAIGEAELMRLCFAPSLSTP